MARGTKQNDNNNSSNEKNNKDETEYLNDLVARVKRAQQIYGTFTQEQVDVIFREAALTAADARIPLAQMAANESRMGVVEDKVAHQKPFLVRVYLQQIQG